MSQISVNRYASSSLKYHPDITIGKELSIAHKQKHVSLIVPPPLLDINNIMQVE
jgi:hypothetical protein